METCSYRRKDNHTYFKPGTLGRAALPGIQLFGIITLGDTEALQTEQASPHWHRTPTLKLRYSVDFCVWWEIEEVLRSGKMLMFSQINWHGFWKYFPCENCAGRRRSENWFFLVMKCSWIQKPKQMQLRGWMIKKKTMSCDLVTICL